MARGTFGTVHQLPSGRFRALYHGPDGRRYGAPTTFTSRKAAQAPKPKPKLTSASTPSHGWRHGI